MFVPPVADCFDHKLCHNQLGYTSSKGQWDIHTLLVAAIPRSHSRSVHLKPVGIQVPTALEEAGQLKV